MTAMVTQAETSTGVDDLSIVVPAFNEEAGLAAALKSLIAAFPKAEIIVVNDGSTDATRQVAVASGVRVIDHAFNSGQGASLKNGMRAASRPWVAWFDADNEHRAEDLHRLVARAREGSYVAVIGQRTGRSLSVVRSAGKWLIRLIGRGLKIRAGSDLNCGLRVFRRNVIMRYLPLIPDRFSASLFTTLILLERRYPIVFEEVQTNPRIGTSTVRLNDGVDAMLILLRCVLLFAPLRFFLPVGGWVFLIGFVYSSAVAVEVRQGIPVGGMFLLLTGMLIWVLGLIADQISQMRLVQLGALALADAETTPHEHL